MNRTVLIARDAVFGYNLRVAGLPPIWCATRDIAVTLYAQMLPF